MFRPDQMGIYFHWPFCRSKCPYCDFNVHIRGEIDHARWAQAYVTAIEYYARMLPDREIVSVFFGGGTPSLMEPETVEIVLDAVQKNWRISNDFEVTLEANPTSVEIEKFKAFRAVGINRVSLGVQALNDQDLAFLGRMHSVDDALRAIAIASETFESYSFDLIYARPQQTLTSWQDELETALKYARGHLSLYQLTIERNTPFYMQYHRGAFAMPDEVQGAEFYLLTQDILTQGGLPSYEISNHAAAGHECRHNLLYWHYADYIGIGPGAHGRYMNSGEKHATRDHAAPEVWLESVLQTGCGAHPVTLIDPSDRFAEILMMGLRLKEGVKFDRLKQQSGINFQEGINTTHLARAKQEGWLETTETTETTVKLTNEGLLRFNSLLPYLLK